MNRKGLTLILQIFSISSGYGGLPNPSSRDILRNNDDSFLVVLKRYSNRGYTDFSDSEAQAIVDRHNFHRSKPRESAANMRLMVRSPSFAFIFLGIENIDECKFGCLVTIYQCKVSQRPKNSNFTRFFFFFFPYDI